MELTILLIVMHHVIYRYLNFVYPSRQLQHSVSHDNWRWQLPEVGITVHSGGNGTVIRKRNFRILELVKYTRVILVLAAALMIKCRKGMAPRLAHSQNLGNTMRTNKHNCAVSFYLIIL